MRVSGLALPVVAMPKAAKKAEEAGSSLPAANEYLAKLRAIKAKHGKVWSSHAFFDNKVLPEEARRSLWRQLDDTLLPLIEQYAWACPDDKSLLIIKHFSPLIEIGAGNGYWAFMLRQMGVDILAFDKYVNSKTTFTKVEKGGTEKLSQKKVSAGRTLFLCYPDEMESIASTCLDNFEGDTIIHVGELMVGAGTAFGHPQSPFGRTSSSDFQVMLSEQFHPLLIRNLENRLPYSKDCISVWRRTRYVKGKEHDESTDETAVGAANVRGAPTLSSGKETGSSSSKKRKGGADSGVEFMSLDALQLLREASLDEQYAEGADDQWAAVPAEELLPVDRAADCLRHLL